MPAPSLNAGSGSGAGGKPLPTAGGRPVGDGNGTGGIGWAPSVPTLAAPVSIVPLLGISDSAER